MMARGKHDFDEVLKHVRAHFETGQRAQILAVTLTEDRPHEAQVAFLGNTTSLRRLTQHALGYLLEDARDMTAQCPCARCAQNLDLIERAYAVINEVIPADRN